MYFIRLISCSTTALWADNLPIGGLNGRGSVRPRDADDLRPVCIDLSVRNATEMVVVTAGVEHDDLRSRRYGIGPAQHTCTGITIDGADGDGRVIAFRPQHSFKYGGPSLIGAHALAVCVASANGKNALIDLASVALANVTMQNVIAAAIIPPCRTRRIIDTNFSFTNEHVNLLAFKFQAQNQPNFRNDSFNLNHQSMLSCGPLGQMSGLVCGHQ